ncbi:MAG: dTDP-4-dehydrorhamnose 3,5-epimerase [Cyclobacteriaceae bacterium]|nr:dTDP-4-dehydrorhamnose 3,5-epimerase [Cyclobacteriaceae bacterium HetDA_MAG_MS6]
MEVIKSPLKDCFVIKNHKFGDDRGFFLEAFNQKRLLDQGISFDIKQVNFAKSAKNVLRGLHYQLNPKAQGKLIGVVSGAVLDVVVDLRKHSPTYLQHFKLKIEDPETQLLIPKGFAHGYFTLEDDTIFYYGVNEFYSADDERGIHYADQTLAINWELEDNPIISRKDLEQPFIETAEYNF